MDSERIDRDGELSKFIREHYIGPSINIDFDPFFNPVVGISAIISGLNYYICLTILALEPAVPISA